MQWQKYEGYGRWIVGEVNPEIPPAQLWRVEFFGPNAEAQAREYVGCLERAQEAGAALGKAIREHYDRYIDERIAR